MGPDGAKALSDVLKFHGNIKTLMIGWCKIGPKGAEFIADTLKYNNTISTLDLRANGLSDDVNIHDSMKLEYEPPYLEMKELSQALKANEDVRLASLNLASNFLTKLGQSAIITLHSSLPLDHQERGGTRSIHGSVCSWVKRHSSSYIWNIRCPGVSQVQGEFSMSSVETF
ncbi:NLR family CARD domain-containing protein 3 isoform X2 [Tanacetum coccineum]